MRRLKEIKLCSFLERAAGRSTTIEPHRAAIVAASAASLSHLTSCLQSLEGRCRNGGLGAKAPGWSAAGQLGIKGPRAPCLPATATASCGR